MRFINTLHEGETIRGIYLCKTKRTAETRNGKPYDNLLLQDKTGTLDGKIWDPNSGGIADYDEMDFVEVLGEVISYNNNLQLNIKQLRKPYEDEYNPADYMPTTEKSVDGMYEELLSYIGLPSARREEEEIREKAKGLIHRLALDSYMNEKASSLPYGAQRRLEIARALATSPDFLLLDEPAAGMNPQESTELMRFIRHIRDEFDLTILLIEHDMKVVILQTTASTTVSVLPLFH